MKKTLAALGAAAAVLTALLAPAPAHADDLSDGCLTYTVDTASVTASVTGIDSTAACADAGTLAVPPSATLGGRAYLVNSITALDLGDHAVTSVTLPTGMTSIGVLTGDYLASIVFQGTPPSSVTTLGLPTTTFYIHPDYYSQFTATSWWDDVASTPAQLPPRPSGFTIAFGSIRGGFPIQLLGADFAGVTSLTIDGVTVSPSSVSVVPGGVDAITAILPAGNVVGVVDVTVHGPGGDVLVPGGFEYTGPTVSSLSWTTDSADGSSHSVNIVGSRFIGVQSVSFGSITLDPADYSVSDSSLIVVHGVPASPTVGPVHVRVTTSEGTSPATDADLFTYIGALSPGTATVTGDVFAGSTLHAALTDDWPSPPDGSFLYVWFVDGAIAQLGTDDSFVVPAGASSISLQVGLSARYYTAAVYTVGPLAVQPPTLAVAPGPYSYGTPVDVTGTRFVPGASYDLVVGSTVVAADVVAAPDGSLAATATGLPAGAVTIVAEPHGGGSAVASVTLTVVAPSVSVSGRLVPGGTLVLNGSGFPANTSYEVVLHSSPATLGSTTTDATGALSFTAAIPADASPGAHTVTISSAGTTVLAVPLTLAAPPTPEPSPTPSPAPSTPSTAQLPQTGSDVIGLASAGATALAIGLALLTIRRRRASR